jgi:hypothetical protein
MVAAALCPFVLASNAQEPAYLLRGVVRCDSTAISGAIVRIQTTEYHTVSGPDGSFELSLPFSPEEAIKLTAWAKGYYIGGPVTVMPTQNDVTIYIHTHHEVDNAGYRWRPALSDNSDGEAQACAECHSRKGTEHTYTFPVDEWLQDAHSQSAKNPRFLSMFTGEDLSGRSSPPTRYFHTKDYGTFPLLPDSEQAYYGPGFKLDFPDHTGNCAACHVPAAAAGAPYDTDPKQVAGVAAEGITCDFCHKIWDVRLDPVSGLPYENRPGVMSFEFMRPSGNHQFFAGPFDDVAPGEDVYSPLQQESQICAPCHHGVFWDTIVYNSFGEWLASPYSHPEKGKTCQDCHMPPSGARYFALPEKGGLEREPSQIFSHNMPGALNEKLLKNAVTMKLNAEMIRDGIEVHVTIVNDQTGHHVPTDSPLRHMILLVRAFDDRKELQLLDGPQLPEWCGVGDLAEGYYAGLPGKAYAKVLKEDWTHVYPSGAYWNPTTVVSDNRIAAFAEDASRYVFSSSASGHIRVEATLFFRRAFKKLMDVKGWEVPDIIMERETVALSNL